MLCRKKQTSTRILNNDSERSKAIEWQKICHIITNHKKPSMALLVSDKRDFKTRSITRYKEVHFITLKMYIHLKDINIIFIVGEYT